MKSPVRPEILTLDEYTLKQRACRIKLNQNENPYELPNEIKEDILRKVGAARWSRYPEFVPRAQLEQVAAFVRWRPDGTLLGNGSNDLLQLLFTCVLGPGRGVVISQPTFTLYKILARGLGAAVHEVPMRASFRFDVDGLIDACNRTGAALLMLCSPNNPTGTMLAQEDLLRILESTTALVAVDEAYVQFANGSCVKLLGGEERLVVFQTFSKAFGAAGLRFGYLLGAPPLVAELNKLKLPYGVNLFTLTAAEVLIERWESIRGWLDQIVREREATREQMRGITGITVYESSANFLLFETHRKTPREVFDALLARGILIRDVSAYPGLARGMRVSIGTPEENREFLSALREAV